MIHVKIKLGGAIEVDGLIIRLHRNGRRVVAVVDSPGSVIRSILPTGEIEAEFIDKESTIPLYLGED